MVKCPPANAGDADSVPGLGRSPEEEVATHSSILACEVPRTEEPGGPQSRGHRESDTTQQQQYTLQRGSVLGVLGAYSGLPRG